jgi:hypothetical protein
MYDLQNIISDSLYDFAENNKGSNDTIKGVLLDVIKKGKGDHIVKNLPELIKWATKEVSDELARGEHLVRNSAENNDEFDLLWSPEIEAYVVAVYILEQFINFDVKKQRHIAGL